jgi:hypothetical protein
MDQAGSAARAARDPSLPPGSPLAPRGPGRAGHGAHSWASGYSDPPPSLLPTLDRRSPGSKLIINTLSGKQILGLEPVFVEGSNHSGCLGINREASKGWSDSR